MLKIFKGLKQVKAFTLLGCFLSLFSTMLFATDDTICAVVKLEIAQELTLERQGFEAIMKINNALEDRPLTHVAVEVNFLDANGDEVVASSDPNHDSAKFFIRIANVEGIDNVSGTGELAPSSSATVRWLIVPAPGSGGNFESGTLYYVGATLTYRLNDQEDVLDVAPDTIFVKPMPQLVLDYFLPSDVYADDPLTAEIEPVEPFTLGVRVRNNGSGPANKVKIESAQPKIVENKQGLLIDFEITGSFINDQAVANSLLLDFGNIAANESATGRWIMQTTLSGKFTEFDASFSHADELGGSLTSLIDSVNTHLLIHDVLVDLPGRDLTKDFLVAQSFALTVFESDSVDTPVTDLSSSATLLQVKSNQYKLTFTADSGAAYIQITDPFQGEKSITQAVRFDGRVVNISNVWLSKTYNKDQKKWLYFINLFDTQTSGEYLLDFETMVVGPSAPVLQHISNWTSMEGQQIGFLIEASDINGDAISFSVNSKPNGAELVNIKNGQARFNWLIKAGQAGNYPITVTASDGKLYANQKVMLTVFPEGDSDGDGLDDEWEILYFGDLSHDGSADFDGDGISDKDEYLQGTDPTLENGPQAPVIVSPNEQTVTQDDFSFVVNNAVYAGDKILTYFYEIYHDAEMSQLLLASSAIKETADFTRWQAISSLQENNHYFWRVRAYNSSIYSPWSSATFYLNIVNEVPTQVTLNSPAISNEVDNLMPVLSVYNAIDPDGDELSYQFHLYADDGLTNLLAVSNEILENSEGLIQWKTAVALEEGGSYYWQVTAKDNLGLSSLSEPFWFTVFSSNKAPLSPVLIYPALDSVVDTDLLDIKVQRTTDPDGDTLSYRFELDRSISFDSSDLQSATIEQVEQGDVVWSVFDLQDGFDYYWRVKAVDDNGAYSEPTTGHFSVVLVVEPPQAPVLNNPGNESWVESLTPTLSLYPVTNSDRPVVNYEFEIYSDNEMTDLLDSALVAIPSYMVSIPFADNSWYFWRARAIDNEDNTSDWSAVARFFVNDQGADEKPIFNWLLPTGDIEVNQGEKVKLVWDDQDPDSSALLSLFYARTDTVVIVDDADTGFTTFGKKWKKESSEESAESYHYLRGGDLFAMARWTINNLMTGQYELQVYLPETSLKLAETATYGFETSVDESMKLVIKIISNANSGWVSLGQYNFVAGEFDLYLKNQNHKRKFLLADKVRLVPVAIEEQLIVDKLDEDLDGQFDSYVWDTSEILLGEYQITAIISDASQSVRSVLPYFISVTEKPAISVDNSDSATDSIGNWLHDDSQEGFLGDDYTYADLPESESIEPVSFTWHFSVVKDAWYEINFHNLAGFENAKLNFKLLNGDNSRLLSPVEVVNKTIWGTIDNASWLEAGDYQLVATLSVAGLVAVDVIELREINVAEKSELEIDNQSAGFTTKGSWKLSSEVSGYVGADYSYLCSDKRGKAEWRAHLNETGPYEVFAKWTSNNRRTAKALYSIYHNKANGKKTTTRILKNQKIDGGEWQSLGIYNFSAVDAKVTLSNRIRRSCVIADAVKFVKYQSDDIILDNSNESFKKLSRGWYEDDKIPGFVGSDYSYSNWGKAKWSTQIKLSGRYKIEAKWTSNAKHSDKVEYSFYSERGKYGSKVVSQQSNGGIWQVIGEYNLDASELSVYIKNKNRKKIVIADAIKITKISDNVIELKDKYLSFFVRGKLISTIKLNGAYNLGNFFSGFNKKEKIEWKTKLAKLGRYRVSVNWSLGKYSDGTARYQVVSGDDIIAVKDQTEKQSGSWQELGIFDFTSENIVIRLNMLNANGKVNANGVRLERLD